MVAHYRAKERMTEYPGRPRSLALELALASERERRQIAQELHDQIGQNLAAIKFKLGLLAQTSQDKELLESLALLERTIQSSRNLTFELSPPVLHEWACAPRWNGWWTGCAPISASPGSSSTTSSPSRSPTTCASCCSRRCASC